MGHHPDRYGDIDVVYDPVTPGFVSLQLQKEPENQEAIHHVTEIPVFRENRANAENMMSHNDFVHAEQLLSTLVEVRLLPIL